MSGYRLRLSGGRLKDVPPLTSPLVQMADRDSVVIMHTTADIAMMRSDPPKYKTISVVMCKRPRVVYFWIDA